MHLPAFPCNLDHILFICILLLLRSVKVQVHCSSPNNHKVVQVLHVRKSGDNRELREGA